ncbi:hypothetical protein Fuma_01157 [Fuerstiella marisgermanici]|uniref:Uncharacterized protein n=1 Tax=Fuerstiella marisgermanici TaxID=1891926 RepID=A0A1P8WBX2_9PLAN|nr:hypothetical protein Fuma_01157 [Fuerstiella marisgermanici]
MNRKSEKNKLRKRKERERRVQKQKTLDRESKRYIDQIRSGFDSGTVANLTNLSMPARDKLVSRLLADPKTRGRILPSEFPRRVKTLCRLRSPIASKTLQAAIEFTASILKSKRETTLQVYELSEHFHCAIVSGNLQTAETMLQSMTAKFGVSLWSVESELLLGELNGPSGIIVGRGRVLRSRRGWRF